MATRQMSCRVPASCVLGGRARVNRIVVYEPTDCAKVPPNTSPVGSAFGARIRVCRGRLKNVCPPTPCDCPSISCKSSFRERLKKMFITATKASILGGLIYATWLYGVWSDAEDTAKLSYDYMKWSDEFFWTTNKIKRSPEQMYDRARIRYNFKNVSNNIMIHINDLSQAIPRKFWEYMNWIFPRRAKVQQKE